MLSLCRAWQPRGPLRQAAACSRCMKQMALVDYTSDSSASSSRSARSRASTRRPVSTSARAAGPFDTPLSKKRKPLPSLPGAYQTGVNPKDDPAQHQGRKRTRPYVEGDYITHVSVSLTPSRPLVATLNALADHIQSLVPNYRVVRNYLPSNPALHVSLTHPLALRRSQIDDFRNDVFRACRSALPQGKGVAVSLAGDVRVYHNGTRTGGVGQGGRAFFALRLGAGQPELNRVKRALEPLLSKMHLPVYHGDDPEFHTSFAWCLLTKDPSTQGVSAPSGAARPTDTASVPVHAASTSATPDDGATLGALLDDIDDTTHPDGQEPLPEGQYPPLPPHPLTGEKLKEVSEHFTSQLLEAQPKGGWEVDSISLRIANKLWDVPIC